MTRAMISASLRLGAILPSLALVVGVAGFLGSARVSARDSLSVPGLADADFVQVDQVLARRAPDLGIDVRRRVAGAILEESRAARFDPMMVLGLIEAESAFSGDAVSHMGARGLMQLMPVTLAYVASLEGMQLGVEEIYRDPALQVRLAVRYLSRLEKRFHSVDLALMAYNGGPERLRQALEEGDADRWFGNYVRAVRLYQARFRKHLAPSSLAQAERSKALPGSDLARMP